MAKEKTPPVVEALEKSFLNVEKQQELLKAYDDVHGTYHIEPV